MNKGDWIKKWALAIGIAIVFNLFENYGIATFSDEPAYSDFCEETFYPRPAKLDENITQAEFEALNEKQKQCNEAYNEARKVYDGNVFIILVVLGVIAVLAGVFIQVQAVASGFLFGGILSVMIGTLRNWSHLADVWRFVILGLVLALLVWIGFKKLKD